RDGEQRAVARRTSSWILKASIEDAPSAVGTWNRSARIGVRRQALLEHLHRGDAAEACVVVAHRLEGVIERRRGAALERCRPGPALEFVAAGLGLRGAPFPHVAAQVVDAVRADSGLVAVDGRRLADAVLPDVALRRGGLVAPGVRGAACPPRGLLP